MLCISLEIHNMQTAVQGTDFQPTCKQDLKNTFFNVGPATDSFQFQFQNVFIVYPPIDRYKDRVPSFYY